MAWLRAHRLEVALLAGSLAVLAAFAAPRLPGPSRAPHFMYQAEAWLHGQLALTRPPPDLNDWARVGDRWYVSFPPGPALVMLPGVALAGVRFPDVAFTVAVGALDVLLAFLVLERLRRAGDSRRTRAEDAGLALLLGFGTVAFPGTIRGEVWFTAQTLGVAATCLYLLAAHRAAHPWLAGLAFGFAGITRTPLLFSGVFFAGELAAFGDAGGGAPGPALRRLATWRDPARWRKAAAFALGAAPLLGFAAWANWARFGSPFDFGHGHLWHNLANADVARWGLFSPHYLERQLHAAFTRLPRVVGGRLTYDPEGMSLLLTTPLLALLLWPRERPRLYGLLRVTAAAVALPGFLYHGTGWMQFGYRFSVDWAPYLFLLLAVGGRPMDRRFWALGLAGVAVCTWGALVFVGSG